MEERLQKILSRAGIASRRGAEKVMSEGRVTVNGTTVRELGSKADAATDDIRVDGVRVRATREPVYLLLNKPKGVVTTRHDPEGRPTVMQLVPPVAGLFPVGRLDLATEGLILLTNDGEFAQKVSHPSYEVARTYEAKVRDIPDTETLARMRRGVRVDGDVLKVDHVRILEAENNSWIEITLHEGKNHEVRRLMDAVGHPVSKLRRVALGPLGLKGLKPGEFRSLTPMEVRSLLKPQVSKGVSSPAHPSAPRRPAMTRHEGARQPKRPRALAAPTTRRPHDARNGWVRHGGGQNGPTLLPAADSRGSEGPPARRPRTMNRVP
jgi:23S rRNA pseudouridine2605 synthase